MSTLATTGVLSNFRNARSFITQFPIRSFATSHASFKGKSTTMNIKKSEQLMRKFSQERNRKKRKWFIGAMHGVNEGITSTGKKNKPENNRRLKQLGVILYDHITSAINNGEIDPKLIGVEISKVVLAPDHSAVLVHWIVSGDQQKDDIMQALLQMNARRIRSYLINMHVMGNIPTIQFVKDKSVSRMEELEYLLKMADKGPDFVPSNVVPENFLHTPSLQEITDRFWSNDYENMRVTNTVQEITNQIKDIDLEHCAASDEEETSSEVKVDTEADFPSGDLKSDVYGLDHSSISSSLLRAKRKIRNRHNAEDLPPQGLKLSIGGDTSFKDIDLKKFLSKRKSDVRNKHIGRYDSKTFHMENMRNENIHEAAEMDEYEEDFVEDYYDIDDYIQDKDSDSFR